MTYTIVKEHLTGILAGMTTHETSRRPSPLEAGRVYGSLTSGRYVVRSVTVSR